MVMDTDILFERDAGKELRSVVEWNIESRHRHARHSAGNADIVREFNAPGVARSERGRRRPFLAGGEICVRLRRRFGVLRGESRHTGAVSRAVR